MKNIHIIPTDKPSRLHTYKGVLNLAAGEFVAPAIVKNDLINQNIYITYDGDINENDYIITSDGKLVQVSYLLSNDVEGGSKIILTTDQDLIKDGVQAIPDEFLEWFVKNPSCEEAEVELHIGSLRWSHSKNTYKIIIPKEEPMPVWKQIIETCGGEEEFMKSAGLLPKEETLEGAAKKYSELIPFVDEIITDNSRLDFMAGAKWQAERSISKEAYEDSLNMQKCSNAGYKSKINELKSEIGRMYSEEELLKILESHKDVLEFDKDRFNHKEWFEQFKKK